MKTLEFEVTIRASRSLVWDTMLGPEGYRAWTAAFCEGSHYVGSWEVGAKIRFLAPSGDGMASEIAESRPHEFVSIRHLGVFEKGVEDTTSDKVRAWAPAYENYTFSETPEGCRVLVTLDTAAEWEQVMLETYPKALASLQRLCEQLQHRTLSTQRVLPFAPAQIYAAFEAPEVLASWWGPNGFTNRFEVFEFKPGGRWVFTMIGPDGRSYANTSRFVALHPGRLITIHHDCAPLFTLTVQFVPQAQGTLLTWDQTFDDAETAQAVRAFVGDANEQNLDRLTQALLGAGPVASTGGRP